MNREYLPKVCCCMYNGLIYMVNKFIKYEVVVYLIYAHLHVYNFLCAFLCMSIYE